MCEDGKIRSGCNGRIPGRPNRCGTGREGHAPSLGQKPWGPFGNGRRRLRPFAGGLYLREAPVRLREGADMRPVGGGRIPHDAPERCMPVSGTAGARLCRPEPSGCPKRRAGSVRSRRGPVDEYVGLPGSGRRSRTARSFTAGVSSKRGSAFQPAGGSSEGCGASGPCEAWRAMCADPLCEVSPLHRPTFSAAAARIVSTGGGARTADAAVAHDRYGFAYDDTMH